MNRQQRASPPLDSELHGQALKRAGTLAVVGLLLAVLWLALGLHGLSHANRPHELEHGPLLAVLFALQIALWLVVVALLARAWKTRLTGPRSLRSTALFAVALVYACLPLIVFGLLFMRSLIWTLGQ